MKKPLKYSDRDALMDSIATRWSSKTINKAPKPERTTVKKKKNPIVPPQDETALD